MAWQRPVRVGLAAFVVVFGVIVSLGIRDRAAPARAVVIERTDPEALIESRGALIVQAEESVENLRVTAERQSIYRDGTVRLMDGVKVAVASREERTGFTLSGAEATVNADQSEVRVAGGVSFRSDDGFQAEAVEATYREKDGIVRMVGEVSFYRDAMHASGTGAEYDSRKDVLWLADDAKVKLVGAESTIEIRSRTATVAQVDGYMVFEGGVMVSGREQRMEAEQARATFLEDEESVLQNLELKGRSRIFGTDRSSGGLREMLATSIGVHYDETGQVIERVTLAGSAVIELYGSEGGPGSRVTGPLIEVELDDHGSSLASLSANGEVAFILPAVGDMLAREVRAKSLDLIGNAGGTLARADFDGAVEYLEIKALGDGQPPVMRVIHAERLEAGLGDGLSTLRSARFLGSVLFEEGEVSGEADEAQYHLGNGIFELMTIDSLERVPRVVDRRGWVQAETISLTLEGKKIEADGEVESILTTPGDSVIGSAEEVRRPGLLVADEPIYVTAGALSYNSDTSVATYSEGARLWQGATEFRGEEIVLDEAAGNIRATGTVRTRSLLKQINDKTGVQEEAITTGRGETLLYDDAQHRATYRTNAGVTGPRGDMTADTIDLILQADSKTLQRIEAVGSVRLEMPGRWITGDSLIYYDVDGRYEMNGEPVEIVEAGEGECRETTGRTLTFFITADAVSVDGQAEVRTETSLGECPESSDP